MNNPESNAIVIDSSTCVLGEGEYNEFVENYAMSLAIGNSDLDQRKTYEDMLSRCFQIGRRELNAAISMYTLAMQQMENEWRIFRICLSICLI